MGHAYWVKTLLTVIKTIIRIWLRLPLVTKVINQQPNHKVDMSHIDESSVFSCSIILSVSELMYSVSRFTKNHMGPLNMVLYGMGSTFDSQTNCQIIPGNDHGHFYKILAIAKRSKVISKLYFRWALVKTSKIQTKGQKSPKL